MKAEFFSPGMFSSPGSVVVDPPLPLPEDVSLPLTQRLPEQVYPPGQELHEAPDTYGLTPRRLPLTIVKVI